MAAAPTSTWTSSPPNSADAPVLVFIHGGYWRALDKRDHSFVAPAFTRRGVCVVVPNYALCPAVTVPQITMQMVHALAWTWRHIAPLRRRPAPHHGGGPFRRRPPGRDDAGLPVAGLRARPAGRPGEERVVDLRAVRPGSDHAHALSPAHAAAHARAGAHGQPGAAAAAARARCPRCAAATRARSSCARTA